MQHLAAGPDGFRELVPQLGKQVAFTGASTVQYTTLQVVTFPN
jgi:hypothetical protein